MQYAVSVIIPTFQEEENELFKQALLELTSFKSELEVICVHRSGNDATEAIIESTGATCLLVDDNRRSVRLNVGFQRASGEVILFHHPRSKVDQLGIEWLLENRPKGWGAFRHRFNDRHPLLRFTSWYSNFIRGGRGIFYLDHCLFAHRSLLGPKPFPEVEIFEDTLFCRQLKAKMWPLLLPFDSVTSSVRFRKNGVYAQSLMNQILKAGLALGISPKRMNDIYERGLELNGAIGPKS